MSVDPNSIPRMYGPPVVDPNSIPLIYPTYRQTTRRRLGPGNKLRVEDWGPATDRFVIGWDCWRVIWVEAYVRDFTRRSGFVHVKGWKHWATFPVLRWRHIPRVFHTWFGTLGLFRRVSFHVEEWIWTQEEGWKFDDQF